MGMFDYISFEEGVTLPIPQEMLGFESVQYQTKSLDRTMSFYFVGKDGFLYLTNEFSENKEEKKKIDYHGLINFYSYEITDLIDYSCDYQAKFTDGILQDIKLISFNKIEHESVSEKRKRFIANQKSESKKVSRRISRFIRKYLFSPISSFLGLDNTRLDFHSPDVTCLYGSDSRENKYGLYFDKISTGVCLKKTKFSTVFIFTILGFGFSLHSFKPFNF
jgi:hypothetical protein